MFHVFALILSVKNFIVAGLVKLEKLERDPKTENYLDGKNGCVENVFLCGKILDDPVRFFHHLSCLTRFHGFPFTWSFSKSAVLGSTKHTQWII